jgi:hypothetical protein
MDHTSGPLPEAAAWDSSWARVTALEEYTHLMVDPVALWKALAM